MKLTDDLKARDKSHGCFALTAYYSQSIKDILRDSKNWRKLNYTQKESLDSIAFKIARVLSGDPDLIEHWYDINGYSELSRQDAETRSEKQITAKKRS